MVDFTRITRAIDNSVGTVRQLPTVGMSKGIKNSFKDEVLQE